MVHADERASDVIAVRIVRAVAKERGVEPTAIDEQLYDTVDPEALSSLFSGTQRGEVRFTFAGVPVTVTADGEVSVRR